jgi:hypothetical protein
MTMRVADGCSAVQYSEGASRSVAACSASVQYTTSAGHCSPMPRTASAQPSRVAASTSSSLAALACTLPTMRSVVSACQLTVAGTVPTMTAARRKIRSSGVLSDM